MEKNEKDNFLLRSISGVFIVLINLLFIYSENLIFVSIFIYALGLLMAFEWNEITRTSNKKRKLALLGVVYIIATLTPMLLIKFALPDGNHLLMWLFVVVWSVDTFAYVVGAKLHLGKHKITKISPKKSYEGLLGGMLMAMIFSYIFANYFLPHLKVYLLCFTPLLCVLEQASDITESLLKRKFNVKDSGDFIPGHGGFLDRYDGFLYTSLIFLHILLISLS
jgi:phosphatidate cytidylyltransferase